jgi:flavin reductase (DIM6/NTAB) family NADH-FMN oxidoreductase RutF
MDCIECLKMSAPDRESRRGVKRRRQEELIAALGAESRAPVVAADESKTTRHEIQMEAFKPLPDLQYIRLSAESASRLLYPNPVCFLTTRAGVRGLNVMTLSWLCPANNYGGFVFVIHKTRFSASALSEECPFVLSVAHAGQSALLLDCGKMTGKSNNKFDGRIPGLQTKLAQRSVPLNADRKVRSVAVSNQNAFAALDEDNESAEEEEEEQANATSRHRLEISSALQQELDGAASAPERMPDAIKDTPAHMCCRVIRRSDAADAGHWLVVAQIEEAFVHPDYWDDKVLEPRKEGLPPLLTFLGSQRFSAISRIA